MMSPTSSPLIPSKKSKNLKKLQLNIDLTRSKSNNSTISNSVDLNDSHGKQVDSDTFSNDSWSSIQSIKSPVPLRSTTPVSNLIPPPLILSPSSLASTSLVKPPALFRRIPSLNSVSPSMPKNNNTNNNFTNNNSDNNDTNNEQGKRNASLAINIPTKAINLSENDHGPNTSIGENVTANTNIKNIPFLPFDRSRQYINQDIETTPPSHNNLISSSPMTPSNSVSLSYTSEIKPQTIMHNMSNELGNTIINSNIGENFKFAYPNGPICVLKPNLYLYSEPTIKEITEFDVIINVAHEIKDFSNKIREINSEENQNKQIEYYFIPWTHTSKLNTDFPYLTKLIEKSLHENKKVLIHCQCGVSRSASLIMAYFMKVFGGGYNEAYNRLKEIVPQISPNLSLIYELIEWGEWLEADKNSYLM